jgi:TolB protein
MDMQKRPGLNPKIYLPFLLLLAVGNIGLIAMYAIPAFQQQNLSIPTLSSASSATPSLMAPTPSGQPIPSPQPLPTQSPMLSPEGLRQQGALIFSMSDGLNIHLFAYHPQFFPLTRLTNGSWDDRNPAIRPDGKKIVYSSRQNGYSNLFVLDLTTGVSNAVTDTPEFEGAASWSPDGQWLATEQLVNDTLQIVLLPLDPATPSVQLTNTPDSANYSPAWSPRGRTVAFVSTQNGKEDIWLARLDRIDDRFVNLTQGLAGNHHTPRWSPDGSLLAWGNETNQGSVIRLWQEDLPDQPGRVLAAGDHPAWNASGTAIAAEIRQPNQTGITIYRVSDSTQMMPLTWLPGTLHGLDWASGAAVDWLLNQTFPAAARAPTPALWEPKKRAQTPAPLGRVALAPLEDVVAAYPYLQDTIDDSFIALRAKVGQEIGWDFLANLENAYIPLTVASSPGTSENWLYTGRAIAVNAVPIPAGWMSITREEMDGQTYWRIYLRARFQDGSQGIPLTRPAWDLNARSSGSPNAYEEGGQPGPIPTGYWIDFTELAARFGWERQPSLVNWRTYYPAIRFNILVQRSGLNWKAAMDQLYPPEALATPTPFITATITPSPTRTPWYFAYLTQSVTPTITLTPTRRPTLTPPGTPQAP